MTTKVLLMCEALLVTVSLVDSVVTSHQAETIEGQRFFRLELITISFHCNLVYNDMLYLHYMDYLAHFKTKSPYSTEKSYSCGYCEGPHIYAT